MAYKGEARPERGILFTLQVYEMERNLSFRFVKRPKSANGLCMAVKMSGIRSGFLIYSYLKDIAFTAFKRGAKF